MNYFVEHAQPLVQKLFEQIGEGEIHGYAHALEVLDHARRGLETYPGHLKKSSQIAVLLAALLHDVDDDKLFPHFSNFENARRILAAIGFPLVNLVVEMIGLVSFSKNGISEVYLSKLGRPGSSSGTSEADSGDRSQILSNELHRWEQARKANSETQHRIPRWKLIPRWADRLCALGIRGVSRCLAFGGQQGRPIYPLSSHLYRC